MTAFALLFTLAAIGISETVYLIRTRRAAERPVCIIGSDCTTVLTSVYNHIFYIHNDVAGLLFYVAASLLTALLVLETGDQSRLVTTFTLLLALGSLMSIILMYIQWRLIKAWCFWCVMSACTIWLMTIILAFHFRSSSSL
jgi:uncharacterized membrane protein